MEAFAAEAIGGFDQDKATHTKLPCWLMTPVAMEVVSVTAIVLIWLEANARISLKENDHVRNVLTAQPA